MAQYYLSNKGRIEGPFDVNQLVAKGMTQESLVKADGQDKWVKAVDVPEVASMFNVNLPKPQPSLAAAGAAKVEEVQPNYEEYARVEFFDAIRDGFSNYFNFKGRARRSEYWFFVLFSVIFSALTLGVGFLLVAVPLAAVSIRRLHDIAQTVTIKENFAIKKDTKINISSFFKLSKWCVVVQFLLYLAVFVLLMWFFVFNYSNHSDRQLFKLIAYIAIFVSLLMVAFYVIDGDKRENKYGESPKYFISDSEAVKLVTRPMKKFFEAFVTCYKKYFNFSDRARRSEFWWFFLYAMFMTAVIFSAKPVYLHLGNTYVHVGLLYFTLNFFVFLFVVFIPLMAAASRRLHDTNHSGIWLGVHYLFLIFAIKFGEYYAALYSRSRKLYESFGEEMDFIFEPDKIVSFREYKAIASFIYDMAGINKFMELIGWGAMITALAFLVAAIAMCCLDSDRWTNEYGDSPKYKVEGQEDSEEDEF